MLFDLKGKRRRAIQVTYVGLAVAMAGGLILFGIGGGVSGGLVNALNGGSGGQGGGGNSIIQGRIDQDNKTLRANPSDENALKDLVRSNYQLAAAQADPNSGRFAPAAQAPLHAADAAWQRYVGLNLAKPDDTLAGLMVQAYSELGLNQPLNASHAAEIVAAARPSAQASLVVTRYAALAGDHRVADLAGDKAVALAPPDKVDAVKNLVAQVKAPPPQQPPPPPGPGQGG
jgi:hypothetical protein